MTTHLTILTGASRGLGLALAEQLLQAGHRVLAIARRPTELPVPAGAELISWQADLAAPADVAARLEAWLQTLDPATLASATLVNNAGVASAPGPLSTVTAGDLANAIRVGLEAPLLLSAAFLRATAEWRVPRKLLLVSSGLGRRGMAGCASYCAAKAGLDNLARAVALEEADKVNGARIVSLAPGVIDTDMQAQLRGADPVLFPNREGFAALHAGGQLDSPAQAAAKMVAFLARADFGSVPVTDLRS